VRFQENARHTTTFIGGTPMWRQSLCLPFRPPQDDFTPVNLEQVRDDVIFSLFDEVTEVETTQAGTEI
jgi:coiled-coil and C2 domain-containing protein 2A